MVDIKGVKEVSKLGCHVERSIVINTAHPVDLLLEECQRETSDGPGR
jgi:hypothetical protein